MAVLDSQYRVDSEETDRDFQILSLKCLDENMNHKNNLILFLIFMDNNFLFMYYSIVNSFVKESVLISISVPSVLSLFLFLYL